MKDEKIVQLFRDERSMELYNKLECELGLNERMILEEYIDDYIHPEWRPIIIDGKKSKYDISNLYNPITKGRRYIYTVIDLYTRMAYARVYKELKPGYSVTTILEAEQYFWI